MSQGELPGSQHPAHAWHPQSWLRFTALHALLLASGLVASACSDYLPYVSSRAQLQQRAAESLRPGQIALAPAAPHAPKLRPFRVRVWAARDYRIEVREWQAKFRRLVERATAQLGPVYGVDLEVVELKPWERTTAGQSLASLVGDLEKADPGADVDWVIGLATALPTVSGTVHELGMASLLSRHFVLRNLSDALEYKAMETAFDQVAQADRDSIYAERKQHKELVLLLHEWGHTLGAIHVLDDSSLMHPFYDEKRREFSTPNTRIIELALGQRASRPSGEADPRAPSLLAELKPVLETSEDVRWEASSLAELKAMVAGSPAPVAALVQSAATDDRERDRADWIEASGARDRGDYAAAFRALSELNRRHPDDARLALWACDSGCRAHADAAAITAACDAALVHQPKSGAPLVLLASALLDEKKVPEARAALERLRAMLEQSPKAAGEFSGMVAPLFKRAGLAPPPKR